ncbi:hypothetical protein SAMN05444748_11665 [Variovorax sp. OV700]|nr:hypothetical protein SAMN05444748_11665 [Variovorax sp. OV700]
MPLLKCCEGSSHDLQSTPASKSQTREPVAILLDAVALANLIRIFGECVHPVLRQPVEAQLLRRTLSSQPVSGRKLRLAPKTKLLPLAAQTGEIAQCVPMRTRIDPQQK